MTAAELAEPPAGARRSGTSDHSISYCRTGARDPSRARVTRLAELEVRQLGGRIARLEARVGILRQQRDNLLDWLLREVIRHSASRRRSGRPSVGIRPRPPHGGHLMAETGCDRDSG